MKKILDAQRDYFVQGKTLNIEQRKFYLKRLMNGIKKNTSKIEEALYLDLGKSKTETYMTEIGIALEDLNFHIHNLKKLSKIKKVKTPLSAFPAKSYQLPYPYGNALVISPWNYPFLLSIQPLVGAIAAGNTVILKPSEYSEHTSHVLFDILSDVFPKDYVYVALGDYKVSSSLLELDFNYIFYTGGSNVGAIVAQEAGKKLIPVTLELGGKNPTIVDKTANLDLAAKRIVFGKFLNCGQTCVAPDFILVDELVEKDFITALKKWIGILYKNALATPDYGKIINERHFQRIVSYMDDCEILFGGSYNFDLLKIEPTILKPKNMDIAIMNEEIFGPLLPVLAYKDKRDLYPILRRYEHSLAFYIFSTNHKFENELISSFHFGGGCINDTIMHLTNPNLPFGGVGASGMGSYHGKKSFETFSYNKSILSRGNWLDVPIRYTPYSKKKEKWIHFFLR